MRLFGKINKGKIVWNDKTKLIDGLRNFTEGTNIVVEIKESVKKSVKNDKKENDNAND